MSFEFMGKIQLAILAGALSLALQANASLYNVSYAGTDGISASGTLDIESGVAVSGTLFVPNGPNPGIFTLDPRHALPGDYLFDPSTPPHASFDNLVSPGSSPFLNQQSIYGGLVWEKSGDPTVGYKMFFNTTAYAQILADNYGVPNTPNVYGLWGWQAPNVYGPQSFGSATLTAVPEASTLIAGALLLLPFGMSTLRSLRKNASATQGKTI